MTCHDDFVSEECQADCALETVMRFCHGRRRCTLTATDVHFENQCRPGVSKYLSVVYACGEYQIILIN